MASKFTRLTHKIAIQLHLVAKSSTICSSCSRRPVRKLLDTPAYFQCVVLRGKRIYFFSIASRLALEPIQFPIQGV